MHPSRSTQQNFIHNKKKFSNPAQSPHKRVGYNFVLQCLANHTQPIGRCQKKLKGDQTTDQHRKCFFFLNREKLLEYKFVVNYLMPMWCTLCRSQNLSLQIPIIVARKNKMYTTSDLSLYAQSMSRELWASI